MFLLHRRDRGRLNFRRRWTSAALLVAYAATAAGVPFPAGMRKHHSAELYPCSMSACGCTSADRCWRSCCCHTLAERLAWAREHGVRPPVFAIAQARSAGLDVSWLAHADSGGGATRTKSCVAKSQPVTHSCCEAHLAKDCAEPARACCADSADDEASASASLVIAWRAWNCRGQSPNWIAAVPPFFNTLQCVAPEFARVAWLGPNLSERAESTSRVPEIPPPEAA